GGITLFQFREKGEGSLDGAEKIALGKQLRSICRDAEIPFIINNDVAPQQGLIDVGLLTNVELTANHTIENGQDHISLKLTGQAVLTLGVLQSTYVIFQLPPEITNVVKAESLEATYNVPGLLRIGRRAGEFSKSDIKVDGNQIYINFKEILALSIGGRYEFTLDFDINTLPSSYEENYTFYGQTTSQII